MLPPQYRKKKENVEGDKKRKKYLHFRIMLGVELDKNSDLMMNIQSHLKLKINPT